MAEQSPLTISVLIPVYNERYLIRELLRRVLAVEIPGISSLEAVVVDDGSTDGSREIVREVAASEPRVRYVEHTGNRGKGAAIQTAVAHARGDLIVFQDADLEYDPRDYARLVRPFFEDGADVVYGSRFLPSERRRVLYYRHALGNKFLTTLTNWFTDLNLTDMETCYKMFRGPLLKSIPLRSPRFGLEPEITMKVAKRNCRIFEVPVSYLGRTYREGKKIGWRDGLSAITTILKYWAVDDIYHDDQAGSHILTTLERANHFNRWMADAISPWVGARVLEIGAGIGNITTWLTPRDHYVASDINEHYLSHLRSLAHSRPYLRVQCLDLEDRAAFEPLAEQFDTVVCLNVLEHVRDPLQALANIRRALRPGGRAVLYVPRGPRLYSSLDRALEHRCRYTVDSLSSELRASGFAIEHIAGFNRVSSPGWYLNGVVLRRERFSRAQLKLFNTLVPVLRRIDHLLPLPPLGLIGVGRAAMV